MLYTWVTKVVIAQKCFKYQISCAGPYILVEKLDKNMSGFFWCMCVLLLLLLSFPKENPPLELKACVI